MPACSVYGPDVFDQSYFRNIAFPYNMPAIWQAQWGFAEKTTGRSVKDHP